MMFDDDLEKIRYDDYDETSTYEKEQFIVDDKTCADAVVICSRKCTGYSKRTFQSPAEYYYDDWKAELVQLDFYDENGTVTVSDEVKERVKKQIIKLALEEVA